MKITKFLRTVLVVLTGSALLGGTARTSVAAPDKNMTRFVAHLGVTNYCFHHWVAKPYREGKFVVGAPHRTASIVKAGSALLFAVRELKAAYKIAAESNDKTLRNVSAALVSVTNSFTSIGRKFKAGKFSPGDVESLNGSFSQLDSSVRAGHLEVKDVAVTVPGT